MEVSVGGDVLKVTAVTSQQQREIIDAWLARHAPPADPPPGARQALVVATGTYTDPGLRRPCVTLGRRPGR